MIGQESLQQVVDQKPFSPWFPRDLDAHSNLSQPKWASCVHARAQGDEVKRGNKDAHSCPGSPRAIWNMFSNPNVGLCMHPESTFAETCITPYGPRLDNCFSIS